MPYAGHVGVLQSVLPFGWVHRIGSTQSASGHVSPQAVLLSAALPRLPAEHSPTSSGAVVLAFSVSVAVSTAPALVHFVDEVLNSATHWLELGRFRVNGLLSQGRLRPRFAATLRRSTPTTEPRRSAPLRPGRLPATLRRSTPTTGRPRSCPSPHGDGPFLPRRRVGRKGRSQTSSLVSALRRPGGVSSGVGFSCGERIFALLRRSLRPQGGPPTRPTRPPKGSTERRS
jgi:hypothetical protein